MNYRKELRTLSESGVKLEMLPTEDPELRRSVAVFKWVTEEVPKLGYRLMIIPTVETEIFDADQVG